MGKGGPRLCLWVLIENLVRRDQGSDDVRCRFEALEEVLIVSKPFSQWEALDVLELHVSSRLGHCQCDSRPSTNAMLDHRWNQRSCGAPPGAPLERGQSPLGRGQRHRGTLPPRAVLPKTKDEH
jgi:hypothetical protein